MVGCSRRGLTAVIFLFLIAGLSTGCSYSFFEKSSNYPPGTTSADFPDYDHYAAETIASKRIPTEIAKEIINLLKDTFLIKGPGQTKCGDVNTFRKFVKMYFKTEKGESPDVEYMCYYLYSPQDSELNWLLSDYKGHTWTLLPPYDLIDTDLRVLKSIDMNVESSLRIAALNDKVLLKLKGVTFTLSKAALKDTAYAWIPQFFLSFDVDKIEITNDGQYVVRLILPLGIPINVKGALTAYLQDKKLRVLGEDVEMTF